MELTDNDNLNRLVIIYPLKKIVVEHNTYILSGKLRGIEVKLVEKLCEEFNLMTTNPKLISRIERINTLHTYVMEKYRISLPNITLEHIKNTKYYNIFVKEFINITNDDIYTNLIELKREITIHHYLDIN